MVKYPLRVWRNTLGHPSNPIINLCIDSNKVDNWFPPLKIPWKTAKAIFGEEVIEKSRGERCGGEFNPTPGGR